jgi:hypothetical protein
MNIQDLPDTMDMPLKRLAMLRLDQGGFIATPEGFDFWRIVSQGEYWQQIPWRSIIDLVRSGKLCYHTYTIHHYMRRMNRHYEGKTETKHT